MTDGAALIAACRASPSDDAPRLIYTDYLEENGQEARAEFIRLGIELRKWEMHPGDRFGMIKLVGKEFRFKPTYKAIKRERELLDEHGIDALLGEPSYQWDYWKPYISRGMVEAMTMPAEAWIAFADKYLLTIQPIRDVYLETLPVLYMKSTSRERYGGSEKFVSTLEETGLIYQSGSNDDWAVAEPAMKERWPEITFHYTPRDSHRPNGVMVGRIGSTGRYSGPQYHGDVGETRNYLFDCGTGHGRVVSAEVTSEHPEQFVVRNVRVRTHRRNGVECDVTAHDSGVCHLICTATLGDGSVRTYPATLVFRPIEMRSRERRTNV